MNKVLIVVAHPDDEALGVGGIIHKWQREGKEVACFFLADGETSRDEQSASVDERFDSARNAANALNYRILGQHGFPDNKLDTVAVLDIAKVIEKVIVGYQPDTILTHSSSDLNIDHRQVLEGVLVASRPQPGCCVKRVASIEIPSATGWIPSVGKEFIPNYFVSLDQVDWQAKCAALNCYADEMRAFPHARSMEGLDALSKYRGSSIGVERAEAIMMLRWIED
jgi:LmbE family N-acetylglucosaminyl deacetylase